MTASGTVLGIDVGATKTDAVLVAPDGSLLARVLGPGANHEVVGRVEAEARVREVVRRLLASALVPVDAVTSSVWGFAGLDSPEDELRHRRFVVKLGFPPDSIVVNDAFLALDGGEAAGHGIAIVSGTGAIVVGRSPHGVTARTLGMGAGRGDWGSGSDIIDAAAQAVAEAHLGTGPETALTEIALRRSGVPTVAAYAHEVWRHARPHLLPPDVWDLVARGDPACIRIRDRVADSLGAGAAYVARQLHLEGEVVLAGRVLDPGHPVLHQAILTTLAGELPGCTVRLLGVAPVAGAAMAAARLAGWEPSLLTRTREALNLNPRRCGCDYRMVTHECPNNLG